MSLNWFRFAVYMTGLTVGCFIGADSPAVVIYPVFVIGAVLIAVFQGLHERHAERERYQRVADALRKGMR